MSGVCQSQSPAHYGAGVSGSFLGGTMRACTPTSVTAEASPAHRWAQARVSRLAKPGASDLALVDQAGDFGEACGSQLTVSGVSAIGPQDDRPSRGIETDVAEGFAG